jgi:hypothetical protein
MIGLHLSVLEVFLHRDAHGRTAAPDTDDEIRVESVLEDAVREAKGILEQLLRGDEDLVHDRPPVVAAILAQDSDLGQKIAAVKQ